MSIKALACAVLLLLASILPARAAEPIRIGFSCEETGGSAASGRQFLLTAQIWADRINKQGGLLGRKVELIHYDDQSNPALVPGIYTKLLDVDKVDLIIASGTNYSAAAMPLFMERKLTVLNTLALAVNDEFRYPRYFQTMPYGAARQGGDHIRVFRRRDVSGPEAENDRDDRRRRRVLEKRDGRGARAREKGRAADCL
jgi:branched-chain amino acid transport system substrate-binding protein